MTMAQIAFYTFGLLREPFKDPMYQEYKDRAPAIWEVAEVTPGYLGPLRTTIETLGYDPRGTYTTPRWHAGTLEPGEKIVLQTITLWADLESVYQFSYQGTHLWALRKRKEWFRSGEWPSYVVWWVAEGDIPTWQQGCERLEHLHDHGATVFAFDFRHPFGPDGEATRLVS
jgi:hypothetical protein